MSGTSAPATSTGSSSTSGAGALAARTGSALSSQPPFDVCIIGAGAAGLVLAEWLSRDAGGSLRVCLVEAGPLHFRDRQEPFIVRSLRKHHLGVNEGRVTAFGGATNTWGGGLIRPTAADFEPLEGRPDTGWPVSFKSLVPHFEAVEALFGFAAEPEKNESVFLDNERVHVRRRPIPILPFRSKNFAQRFGPGLSARPNVTIHTSAEITAFNPRPAEAGGGLSHLSIRFKDGATTHVHARHFVISAGIVNTNLLVRRVLTSCGIDPPKEQPGEYFHDHFSFPVALLKPRSPGKFSRRFGYRFANGLMYGEHFDIEAKGPRVPGAFVHLSFDMTESSILRPVRDVLNAVQRRTLRGARFPSLREWGAMIVGVPRLGICRYLNKRLYIDRGTKVLATLDLEQHPRREMTIGPDTGGAGCDVSWDVAPEDAALAIRFIPVVHDILNGLQREAAFDVEVLIPDPVAQPQAFIDHMKKHSVDTLHSSGGVRMSDQPGALVDPSLRLAGVHNTYVLSAAVFPRVGTSNPTLTILALGHRLAQHLLTARHAK